MNLEMTPLRQVDVGHGVRVEHARRVCISPCDVSWDTDHGSGYMLLTDARPMAVLVTEGVESTLTVLRQQLAASLARCKELEEAMALYREASYQSHDGHWDKTGGGGSGCPQCIRARELRSKAERALTPTERTPA